MGHLATNLQQQNEALQIEKGHMDTIKGENQNSSSGMQGTINDISTHFKHDIQRMQEEFRVQHLSNFLRGSKLKGHNTIPLVGECLERLPCYYKYPSKRPQF